MRTFPFFVGLFFAVISGYGAEQAIDGSVAGIGASVGFGLLAVGVWLDGVAREIRAAK